MPLGNFYGSIVLTEFTLAISKQARFPLLQAGLARQAQVKQKGICYDNIHPKKPRYEALSVKG